MLIQNSDRKQFSPKSTYNISIIRTTYACFRCNKSFFALEHDQESTLQLCCRLPSCSWGQILRLCQSNEHMPISFVTAREGSPKQNDSWTRDTWRLVRKNWNYASTVVSCFAHSSTLPHTVGMRRYVILIHHLAVYMTESTGFPEVASAVLPCTSLCMSSASSSSKKSYRNGFSTETRV